MKKFESLFRCAGAKTPSGRIEDRPTAFASLIRFSGGKGNIVDVMSESEPEPDVVTCPECGKAFEPDVAPETNSPDVVTCPKCGHVFATGTENEPTAEHGRTYGLSRRERLAVNLRSLSASLFDPDPSKVAAAYAFLDYAFGLTDRLPTMSFSVDPSRARFFFQRYAAQRGITWRRPPQPDAGRRQQRGYHFGR